MCIQETQTVAEENTLAASFTDLPFQQRNCPSFQAPFNSMVLHFMETHVE